MIHDRVFRLLTRLLPAEFRDDYGREMQANFRIERQEAAGRSLAMARLWAATIGDLCRAAPREHLDILVRDLSYTGRMLQRRPALTLATILTLALGIGANTAIFSVVSGVLFAPLPFGDADRLVTLREDPINEEPGTTGYASFAALRSQQQSFERVAAYAGWYAVLRAPGQDTERVNGLRVTGEYFKTLGVAPALGRDFEAADDRPGAPPVIILGDALWRRRFNGDAAVIGRPISVNSVTYTVIGVMPQGYRDLLSTLIMPEAEAWRTLAYNPPQPPACAGCRHISMFGRLLPNVTAAQAEADATRVYQALAQASPNSYASPAAEVMPIRDRLTGPVRQVLLLIWVAVAVLLLMACANVANILLIRASEREEEVAVRRALGVTRARLFRQFITESTTLAMLGGVAGIAVAFWATRVLAANGPESIPRLTEVTVDGAVLLYACAISLVTGVVFGLAPARMLLSRASEATGPTLAPGTRATAGRASWRLRASLISVNVALSLVLLVASGLLVRSFVSLLRVAPGFDPTAMLTMEVDLSGPAYGDMPQIAAFYDRLLEALQGLPGVDRVAASTNLPLTGTQDQWSITIEGRPPTNDQALEADRMGVAGDYFAAMRIPLLSGRLFTAADSAGAAPVVIVGKTMADQLWPGESPIGRRITLAGGANNPPRTIIGVVGDVKHNGLDAPVSYQAYMPQSQSPWRQTNMTLLIRAGAGQDPLALAGPAREQLRAIDAGQPIIRVRSYEQIVATLTATRRFTLVLVGTFAGAALLLAIVGLYGALSYVIAQRQREIGVRVALGAAAGDIRGLVLSQGMTPVAIGLAAGLGAALAGGRLMRAMLFDISVLDPAAYAAACGAIAVSAIAACLLSARAATRVDPASTLRSS